MELTLPSTVYTGEVTWPYRFLKENAAGEVEGKQCLVALII
jgi:hypothetical protein